MKIGAPQRAYFDPLSWPKIVLSTSFSPTAPPSPAHRLLSPPPLTPVRDSNTTGQGQISGGLTRPNLTIETVIPERHGLEGNQPNMGAIIVEPASTTIAVSCNYSFPRPHVRSKSAQYDLKDSPLENSSTFLKRAPQVEKSKPPGRGKPSFGKDSDFLAPPSSGQFRTLTDMNFQATGNSTSASRTGPSTPTFRNTGLIYMRESIDESSFESEDVSPPCDRTDA
jgi:hypothetical protein